MTLPKFTRKPHKPIHKSLPKDAYVVKIMSAQVSKWPSGDEYIEIAFDIAEGDYAGFFMDDFKARKASGENAVWSYDARFKVNIPNEKSESYVWDKYNRFFTNVEDSNDGFVFETNLASLKGKLFGGQFRIRQSKDKNGNVWDHTELFWDCSADDVRSGYAAKRLPNDKLISDKPAPAPAPSSDIDGFLSIPDGIEEEIPFD